MVSIDSEFSSLNQEAKALEAYVPVPTYDLLGVPVAIVNENSFVDELRRWHQSPSARRSGAYVCFRDVHGVVRAMDERPLRDAHKGALMNAPDGKPLAWMGRRYGHHSIGQVCGPEMMLKVMTEGVALGWRHVLYGATSSVLTDLVDSLSRRIPGVEIVDTIAPPFRALTEEENAEFLLRISAAHPHFVWIGIGSPKQELWMLENAHRITGAISMGVGAAFDMHSDRIARAPRWIRRMGLEWLFRAMREPQRLGPRYARTVPRFVWCIIVSEVKGVFPPLKRSKRE